MSKKIPYDFSMRWSEHGKRLYYYWKKVRREGCDPKFDKYESFYKWAMKTYTDGALLRRKDASKPYSPRNCYFDNEMPKVLTRKEMYEKKAEEWNRVVNRIRKYYRMEPLPGTSYDEY